MKVISWNLNHRTLEKRIPSGVTEFLERHSPDLAFFNEFVDGDSRSVFFENINSLGYKHQIFTPKIKGVNQILAISKTQISKLGWLASTQDIHAQNNFLAVEHEASGIRFIAFRMPSYEVAKDRNLFREILGLLLALKSDEKVICLGDWNEDPFRRTRGKKWYQLDGYTVLKPEGDWSYISPNGNKRSRIDNVMVSEDLKDAKARYLVEYGGILLAGPSRSGAVSDHAVLEVVITGSGL